MANASCSTCTLVSNVLTLAGSVSGSLVVGMTITGASIPPGVTITSFGTGSGGIGTYNCSASAANITVAEAMVFSLSWIMPQIGNAQAPQVLDFGRAAGFGVIFAVAVTGGSAGPGQEYQFGTHAAALYNAQAISGTQVFKAASGRGGTTVTPMIAVQPQSPEYRGSQVFDTSGLEKKANYQSLPTISASPQNYDPTPTLQPFLDFTGGAQSALGMGAEYQFGTHQKALYDSQNGTAVWRAQTTPPVVTAQVPLRSIHVQGQELNRDLTIQGWSVTVPVAQGWLVTMITAGPQLVDLTQQPQISVARPFQSAAPAAPVNPAFFFAQPQFDTTQIPARVIKPPATVAKFAPILPVFGGPSPADQVNQQQIQPQLTTPALPGPSKKLQPAIIFAFEQQYDKNNYPLVFTVPTVYNPPIIPPPVLGPPDISVWTTDSSSITADSIAFTCDGADLINGGAVQVPGLAGRSAYTVSSPNFTPPLPGAALTNNVPLPVTSPPMIYYINGVPYRSGQPI